MADNVTADPGAGGATFATDDDGTAHHPYVKLEWGADNTQTKVAAGAGALPIQDGGNSITVDGTVGVSGTVTVDASGATVPVSNAGLTELAAAINASSQVDVNIAASSATLTVASHAVTNAGTFAVQVTSLPASTNTVEVVGDAAHDAAVAGNPVLLGGYASAAAPTAVSADGDVARVWTTLSGAVNVADGGGTLSIDDGGGAITVDGTVAVSGTVTVGSHAVTNAGTFAVQVDGAALTALQLIDNLVLAEDAAHGSGDPGVQALAVRNDSDASLAGTTGDYTPLQVDANGYLKVNIKAGAGSGGTASTDDAAFTAASGSGTPMMGFVTSDSVDSGDVGVVGMLANRQLKVTLYDSAGAELAVGGGTQYTEDAAAAANPVGNALIVIREDGRAGSLTSADGDNVALRGNNLGELYVKHTDSIAVTDGGGSLTVDGTVAVSGTVTVGSHAVTNAGIFAVQADSVIPGTGATNLGKAEDAAHSSGDVGVMALTVRQDTAAALGGTDADYQPLITDGSGRLHVNVGNTVTVGSHAVTNAGTFAVQVDGAALTALQLIDNANIADDAAFTPASTGVVMGGFFADETSTDSVDEGDGGAARMTLDRRQIVVPQPHASGGLSIFRSLDLDESEEEVKASAGAVYSVWVTNTATSTRWLKFYNATAANVTVGTTTPVITIGIPGNSSDDISGNFGPGGVGIQFDTAISVAATTGVADADTGAPAANDVIVNIFYR